MRAIFLLLVIATLGACDDRGPPASAYRSWKNQAIVAAGLRSFFDLCAVKTETEYGNVYRPLPLDKCYKMDPPRRWKGLWRNDFEGSRFCAAPAKACRGDDPRPYTWFDYYDPKLLPFGGLYSVEFIGRRTSVQGRYGHMGGSDYEIIVDHMVSVEERLRPPQFKTKEDAAAWLKECEARPDCVSLREGLDALGRKRRP